MRKFSQQYIDTINSANWQLLRDKIILKRGYRCQRCNTPRGPLQLHHTQYRDLGHEKPSAMLLLCIPCHKLADTKRKAGQRLVLRQTGLLTKVYNDFMKLTALNGKPYTISNISIRDIKESIIALKKQPFSPERLGAIERLTCLQDLFGHLKPGEEVVLIRPPWDKPQREN